jgi:hypothetical protein
MKTVLPNSSDPMWKVIWHVKYSNILFPPDMHKVFRHSVPTRHWKVFRHVNYSDNIVPTRHEKCSAKVLSVLPTYSDPSWKVFRHGNYSDILFLPDMKPVLPNCSDMLTIPTYSSYPTWKVLQHVNHSDILFLPEMKSVPPKCSDPTCKVFWHIVPTQHEKCSDM